MDSKADALSLADKTEGGLASARRVLRLEATGIENLLRSLDDSFTHALDLLEKVTGRVIVTGMGKSGHVARKMAATLASTGTPASFVHPAEASHGDLGMVTRHDAVIAFSNSGETVGTGRPRHLRQALRDPPDRHHRTAQQRAGRGGRCRPGPSRHAGSLSDGPGAHHLDDGDAGAQRRHRRCHAGAQGLLCRRLRDAASRAASWGAGCCASGRSCTPATPCRWRRRRPRWPRR